MIKGINKQILEVTNPESPYFEKIIFFVRSEASPQSEALLKTEAEKITKKIIKPPKIRKTKLQKLQGVFFLLLGIGAGGAVSFLLSQII